ncbi:winged helix-turn-helix domain-containing protein [Erythrobacter sp.]|uniref:winged helix-turn-helix domain-containing protein n=1 Tax=Erythrobacter sp. TaxID=1042 RepID=UPI001425E8B9|nr:winged helix-turn-helix domain-containing protein [Erythrobacter sp.]QIQ85254.1 MAG: hypothetical protein G9473_00090 [Erythrobacter sp.]QIQ88005.1 MAG: hypothetical protein G9473_15855 [Erythrobacter sp.]
MDQQAIGSHILQPDRQLLKDGERVAIGPRALGIVTVLARRRGEVVTKDELLAAVWPDTIVEENALQVHIASLRKALGEDAALLETIRGVGYCLHEGHAARGEPAGGEAKAAPAAAEPGPVPAKAAPATQKATPAEKAPEAGRRRWPLAAAVLAVVVALALGLYAFLGAPTSGDTGGAASKVTLAVLPFETAETDGEDVRQFATDLSRTMSGHLALIERMALVPGPRVTEAAETTRTQAELAQSLGATHLVIGEVGTALDQTFLDLALVEAGSGTILWRDRFTDAISRPTLGDLALEALVSALQVYAGVGSLPMPSPDGVDPQAYAAFQEGLQKSLVGDIRNKQDAFDDFTRASRIDPDFADAHAGRALAIISGYEAEKRQAIAAKAIATALALDGENLLARIVRARLPAVYGGDIAAALLEFEAITGEAPEIGLAHHFHARTLAEIGEHEAAIAAYRTALDLDPAHGPTRHRYAESLLATGNYSAVRTFAGECVYCTVTSAYWLHALAYAGKAELYDRDVPRVRERMTAIGLPESVSDKYFPVLMAIRDGSPNPLPLSEYGDTIHEGMYLGEFGQYEAGLDRLSGYFRRPGMMRRWLVDFLDTPREEWPEAVRAHPRYHALFADPGIRSLIAERRRRGNLDNLPALPAVPYRGP